MFRRATKFRAKKAILPRGIFFLPVERNETVDFLGFNIIGIFIIHIIVII